MVGPFRCSTTGHEVLYLLETLEQLTEHEEGRLSAVARHIVSCIVRRVVGGQGIASPAIEVDASNVGAYVPEACGVIHPRPVVKSEGDEA